MKKFIVLLVSFTCLFAVSVFPAQYEFDESLTKIADEWSFITTFRENTQTKLMDLKIQIDYLNNEDTEIFKNLVDVNFKFFDYFNPFAYFQYEDGELNYKRLGAGMEILLGSSKNKNEWTLFTHKARVSALYDSNASTIYGALSYAGRVSLPRSEYSAKELMSIRLDGQISGFGESYGVESECMFTDQLSTFVSYEYQRAHGEVSDIFKQGVRVRI